jgi:hypothetical protein
MTAPDSSSEPPVLPWTIDVIPDIRSTAIVPDPASIRMHVRSLGMPFTVIERSPFRRPILLPRRLRPLLRSLLLLLRTRFSCRRRTSPRHIPAADFAIPPLLLLLLLLLLPRLAAALSEPDRRCDCNCDKESHTSKLIPNSGS